MSGKEAVEPSDGARVAVADGAHLDHLAADQLDPVVLPEDAQLAEALVRVEGERAFERAQRHANNIGSAKDPSKCAPGRESGVIAFARAGADCCGSIRDARRGAPAGPHPLTPLRHPTGPHAPTPAPPCGEGEPRANPSFPSPEGRGGH